jgi:hypothetical protein
MTGSRWDPRMAPEPMSSVDGGLNGSASLAHRRRSAPAEISRASCRQVSCGISASIRDKNGQMVHPILTNRKPLDTTVRGQVAASGQQATGLAARTARRAETCMTPGWTERSTKHG